MRPLARLMVVSLLSFTAFGTSPAFANSVVVTETVIARSTLVVAGGISPTMSVRQDHDPQWFFTPHVTAAYFWKPIPYLDVGGGTGVHFWAIEEKNGGTLFTPSLAVRGYFTVDAHTEVGFTASGGWLIGHYNDEWHDGFAVTLAPNVDFDQIVRIFEQSFAVRVGIEATLFHTGEERTDRYQPLLALGASIGLAFPIDWTRPREP